MKDPISPMLLFAETLRVIESCRRELERLQQLNAELASANERSWQFLSGGCKLDGPACDLPAPPPPRSDAKAWLDKAEQARTLADSTADPHSKRLLLEIANTYEELVGK